MKFRASVLEEPLLEFGGGGREIDIRFGLMRHGPLEPERAQRVRLGVIGTSETIEGFSRFLERCQTGIDAKPSRQPNLFLSFPGLASENPFRCAFEIDPRARKSIPRSDITRIVAINSRATAIEEAVTLFAEQAQAVAEAPAPPDVIVCALPFDLITRVVSDAGLRRADETDMAYDMGGWWAHRPPVGEAGEQACPGPRHPRVEPVWRSLLQGRQHPVAAAPRSCAVRHLLCRN